MNIGIGTYRKKDYPEILKISVDSDALDTTWEEWYKNKEKTKAQMQQMGFKVIEVLVTPEELLQYCRENVLRVDGKTRSKFVSEKTSKLSVQKGK